MSHRIGNTGSSYIGGSRDNYEFSIVKTGNDSESRKYGSSSLRPIMITLVSSFILTVLIGIIYFTVIRKDDDRPKVIIDTDGGVDDATAIFLALSKEHASINLLSITTVTGNTDIKNVTQNVLLTLNTIGKKNMIPVYMGAESPLSVKHGELSELITFYFGRDGFGDTNIERPSLQNLPKKSAVVHIVDTVREYPGQVTLLCIGPLTNIALAIKLYPNLLNEVKDIYIVGGSINGRGNMGAWKEFNFALDPEAANIVFTNAADIFDKIYVVPWEITDSASIKMNWRKNVLGAMNKSTITFLNTIDKHVAVGNDTSWQDVDSLLIAIYLFKDKYQLVTETLKTGMSVVTCPKDTSGSTVLTSNRSNIIVFKSVNVKVYEDIFLKYL